MFFFLARYGLEILGEAKKAKREGEGLGEGGGAILIWMFGY